MSKIVQVTFETDEAAQLFIEDVKTYNVVVVGEEFTELAVESISEVWETK